MARLKPERQWSSGYLKLRPTLEGIGRILMLAPENLTVRIEDKHREFESINDLANYWNNLHLPLEVEFAERSSKFRSLSLMVDDFGTILIGTERSPALVALSEEILRSFDAAKQAQPERQQIYDVEHSLDSSAWSFFQRNSDNLIVGVVVALIALGALVSVSYLGLPH